MRLLPFLLITGTLALCPGVFAQQPSTTPAPRASITAGQAEPAADSAGQNALGLGGFTKNRPKDAKTEITAEKEATFDNVAGLATFTGKVLVRDPQLTLSSDKLVITLNKNRKGMDKAEATGNVVIVHESKEKDKAPVKSIGRAQTAIYEPVSGNLILLGSPQVQQGINNHISTEPGTRMILNREGRLSTVGGNKTIITDTTQLDQSQAMPTSTAPTR